MIKYQNNTPMDFCRFKSPAGNSMRREMHMANLVSLKEVMGIKLVKLQPDLNECTSEMRASIGNGAGVNQHKPSTPEV
jgi:hypothetical protein